MAYKCLSEVTIIRPLLILFVVVGHSFAVYSGDWPRPNDVIYVWQYRYIDPIFNNCTMAAFVFISGYLYGLKEKEYDSVNFILKKAKRLIFPLFVFGGGYFLLFYRSFEEYSLLTLCNIIISGPGHLWFLPMLFYCFVVVWLLGKFHLTGNFWLLLPLFVFSVFPFNLPFSIGQMLHYLLYFYLGIMVFRYRDAICRHLNLYVALFLIFFYAFALFLYLYLGVAESLDGVSYNVVRLVLNVMGITAIYSTAVCVGDKLDRYYLVRQSNAVSFGVYLFHQFVLMFLLEYTSLSVHVGRYAYPWLCLAIALLFSVLFSSILMKNRVGRSLIG